MRLRWPLQQRIAWLQLAAVAPSEISTVAAANAASLAAATADCVAAAGGGGSKRDFHRCCGECGFIGRCNSGLRGCSWQRWLQARFPPLLRRMRLRWPLQQRIAWLQLAAVAPSENSTVAAANAASLAAATADCTAAVAAMPANIHLFPAIVTLLYKIDAKVQVFSFISGISGLRYEFTCILSQFHNSKSR
ncbi:hypothetical protein ACFSR7_03260 [Cohnella sp. GCM10020058]|uniref:hypothetical protein n=1 Tax=Cohnella sp. GCM10020058 TaxID=3317330 RepID=UPI00362DE375